MFWPNSGVGFQPANNHSPKKKPRFRRRGQALIEFALVALVTYLLLAAIITFGFLFFGAQVAQSAADVGARELSRTPLPADEEFETVMAGGMGFEQVSQRVFSRDYLVVAVPEFPTADGDRNMLEVITRWPVLNQQLFALMIFDRELQIGGRPVLRYPGTLISGTDTDDGYDVIIPLLNADGSVAWVQPVEEIDTEATFIGGPNGSVEGANPDPFRITSSQLGTVALRVNYPFQSPVMSAHVPNPAGPFEPTVGSPIPATDSYGAVPYGTLTGRGLIDDRGTPETSDDVYTGAHGGNYGVGVHGAMGQAVRPFRRVISAQAIYRREIFN
jgi:hypothetical protein